MDTATILELFGYLGSLIVIVSMLMTSVMKLRIINTVGSLMFSLYALLIHSYPTMIMNLFLAGINIWHLMRLRNHERHYDLIETTPEDGFMKFLLSSFKSDIRKYFPGFEAGENQDCVAFVICCQNAPAGIFLARSITGPSGEAQLDVVLDYTTPTYRDCSVGAYLYNALPEYGYSGLIAHSGSAPHTKYLRKMGFREEQAGRFMLDFNR